MVNTFLIADSGGTSTSWCYVDEFSQQNYFETESFHPHNFGVELFDKAKKIFSENKVARGTKVYFYGTACSLPMNQQKIRAFFEEIGLELMEVESDLLGACRGTLNKQKGLLAIMGTGSIVAAYNGHKIETTKGGFGYLLGDEGSGYCAGKNILHAYLNELFDEQTMRTLHPILEGKVAVLENVYGVNGKKWIGDISKRVPLLPTIEKMHIDNIQSFFELSLFPLKTFSNEVFIVGSYGNQFSAEINEILSENGFSLIKVVKSPIELIVSSVLENN